MPWFTRTDRTARRGELLESAIGASTSLSGVIKSDGGLRIDGHFDGHIDVAGNVVVGEAGVVQVDVLRARNITVGGTVNGNIECSGRLEILATGQVVGDIVADAIMIDQGGMFQGASRMRTAMPVLPPPASPSPTPRQVHGASEPYSGDDDVIIDLGVAPATDEPAVAPPPAAASVAMPASGLDPEIDAVSSAPEPAPETVVDFALDIEPFIPDTAAGSASGAVHQPQAAPGAGGDAASRRSRRPGGGRRR